MFLEEEDCEEGVEWLEILVDWVESGETLGRVSNREYGNSNLESGAMNEVESGGVTRAGRVGRGSCTTRANGLDTINDVGIDVLVRGLVLERWRI